MRTLPRLIAMLSGILAFSHSSIAKDDLALGRITPVPSDQQIPAMDFNRPLLFVEPVLNPSGTRFAALIENQHFAANVLVCDIATGKFEWSDVGSNVTSFMWMNDKELMVDTTIGVRRRGLGYERFGGGLTIREVGDLDKVKEQGWFHGKPGAVEGTTQIIPAPLPSPTNGWPTGGMGTQWVRPENGVLDFFVQNDAGNLSLYRFDGRGVLKSPVNPFDVEPKGIGTRKGEMIALGPRQDGRPRALQYVDVETGALGKVIYQDDKYDGADRIIRRPGTWEVIGVSVPHMAEHVAWLDAKHQHVQEMINHFFQRSYGVIVSADRADTRFLVKEVSDIKPPTYYLLDLEKKSIGLLKNTGPWIDPSRMRPMQPMSYKARDGARIDGYLTLPAGASAEHPAPLVVLPHGGPWNRDTWGWRGDVQFLASRGYAVFQPNYRGSAGYDWRFDPDDRWDFSKMRDDVTDGTRALIRTGVIDPGRIAIVGFGFGGYLAVFSAVDEPGLYRCAVTVAGIFDWKEALDGFDSRNDSRYYRLRLHLNGLKAPDEAYAAISPIKRIRSLRIPVFITNNFRGPNVDLAVSDPQTLELSHGIPRDVPKVVFGDLHIDSMENAFVDAVDRMNGIETFLAQNLAPRLPQGPN